MLYSSTVVFFLDINWITHSKLKNLKKQIIYLVKKTKKTKKLRCAFIISNSVKQIKEN